MTNDAHAHEFDRHRTYLTGIAYRMLGSVADAEDVVQETFLRWQQADGREVRSPKAWLTTAATRIAIDQLRSARVRRESYVGSWLPEPVVTDFDAPQESAPELLESLSTAMLVLLEQLSPAERAAFLLHDVFDYGYGEVAPVLERSEAACRQLVSRARRRIKDRRPRFETSRAERDKLLTQFARAVRTGDLERLTAVLTDDATLMSDGGGKVTAALNTIFGPDKVARFLIGISTKQPDGAYFVPNTVNGAQGLVGYVGEIAYSVVSFELEDGRIKTIHIVNNPDKLAHIGPPRTTARPELESALNTGKKRPGHKARPV